MNSERLLSYGDQEERLLNISRSVEELYRSGLHTDCVLVGSGGHSLRCHTTILAGSNFFRETLPPPDVDKEDTVVVLADWDVKYISHALTILYCGALFYKGSALEELDKLVGLLGSIGVQGFQQEVVSLEELGDFHIDELQIKDVRTETEQVTESVKLEPDVITVGGDQCFRCGGLQSSLEQYKEHLQEHKEDTRRCITKLMEKVKAKDHTADWECESCYITLLNDEEKINLDEEHCWGRLNLHQRACIERVEMEINEIDQKLFHSRNKEDFLPKCDQCFRKFKLKIQLKKHKKNCSLSVLSFLKATHWAECPVCSVDIGSDMVDHLISHDKIMALIEEDTPEDSEYRCADAECLKEKDQLSFPQELRLYFLLHKYKNCKYSARTNLENLLDRVTVKSMRLVEESDGSDEKISLKEVCYEEEENNSNHHVGEKVSECEITYDKANHQEGILLTNQDLKCDQCLRVFKEKSAYDDSNSHLCVLIGNLREPLQEAVNPTTSMLASLRCSICARGSGPVFASELEFKKHVCLAHKGIFILTELKKKGFMSKENPIFKCSYCTRNLTDPEVAVLHTGLDHHKLAQAIKFDRNNDCWDLLKRWFPDKYNKWSKNNQLQKLTEASICSANENTTQVGRNTPQSKLSKPADPDNVEGFRKRKIDVENNKLQLKVKKARGSSSRKDSGTHENTKLCKGKVKQGESKERLVIFCVICTQHHSASFSDEASLKRHMAIAHFMQEILKEYPNPPPNTSFEFPCNFPSCDAGFNNQNSRVQHLGIVHRQVDRCLATPKILEKAKQVSGIMKDKLHVKSKLKAFKARVSQGLTVSLKSNAENNILAKVTPCVEESNKSDMEEDTGPRGDDLESFVTEVRPTTPSSLQLILSDSDQENKSTIQLDVIRKKLDTIVSSDSDESDTEADSNNVNTVMIPPSPSSEAVESSTVANLTTCIYCSKSYRMDEEVHVTCDAAKCKKCFSSFNEKDKHFSENHSWSDL